MAAKIAGRVAEVLVDVGQSVKKGDPVATLESPEIGAKLDQAEAARAAAVAQSEKADRGAREEEIRAAKSQWVRAEAAATLGKTTWERLERLSRDGVVPRSGATRPRRSGRRPATRPTRRRRSTTWRWPAPGARTGTRRRPSCARPRAPSTR